MYINIYIFDILINYRIYGLYRIPEFPFSLIINDLFSIKVLINAGLNSSLVTNTYSENTCIAALLMYIISLT